MNKKSQFPEHFTQKEEEVDWHSVQLKEFQKRTKLATPESCFQNYLLSISNSTIYIHRHRQNQHSHSQPFFCRMGRESELN